MGMIQKEKILDSLLVTQCQSGNRKAMSLLIKRWNAKLCKHSYWYTNDLETSKDIVQDCWTIILYKINTLKDPNRFGGWALTIVSRKTLDWLKKHKKEKESLQNYQYESLNYKDEKNDNSKEMMSTLRASIKLLPYDQQLVLQLFYIEEYTIREISELINVSVGTIKSRLFTAREKLKLILKNKDYG